MSTTEIKSIKTKIVKRLPEVYTMICRRRIYYPNLYNNARSVDKMKSNKNLKPKYNERIVDVDTETSSNDYIKFLDPYVFIRKYLFIPNILQVKNFI